MYHTTVVPMLYFVVNTMPYHAAIRRTIPMHTIYPLKWAVIQGEHGAIFCRTSYLGLEYAEKLTRSNSFLTHPSLPRGPPFFTLFGTVSRVDCRYILWWILTFGGHPLVSTPQNGPKAPL